MYKRQALDHLIMLAADELGASWVRVNGIRPGLIRTELVLSLIHISEAHETPEHLVCRLLLEKKKIQNTYASTDYTDSRIMTH